MGKVPRNILSSHTKIEHWANIFTPGIKILTRGGTKYDIFGNKVICDHTFAAILPLNGFFNSTFIYNNRTKTASLLTPTIKVNKSKNVVKKIDKYTKVDF